MKALIAWPADLLAGQGRAVLFGLRTLAATPAAFARPRQLALQLYASNVLSLAIIVIAGAFVGMVLALQGYRLLVQFSAESALGASVALVIIRELGPVVTALLYAGRAGSSMAAEVGLMRATEQLSGMEMMAVDPMKRVIAPRYIAGVLAMPLLTAIFTVMAIGIAGGYAVGVVLLGVDDGSYWSQIQSSVDLRDIGDAALKALVFGLVVNWIALYQGYHAAPNSEGVSRATTTTVVYSSLAILGLDFVLTAMLFQK